MPRRVALLIASLLAVLVAAPSANAGVLTAEAPNCASESLSQVFLPWADLANYTLAPGGDSENASGWDSLDGTNFVQGNEPWQVTASNDTKALQLPAGSSATTRAMCVGIDHPTLRTFVRSTGTGLLSSLHVDVLFEDSLGYVHSAPVGAVLPTLGNWALTPTYVITASLLPLLPDNMTPVAFQFTPVGSGTWQLDDTYVDPWANR